MAEALFAEMRDLGMLRPDGEPKQIVQTYASIRKTQLQYERELGMTPAARMAIKANSGRAVLDLPAQMPAAMMSEEAEGVGQLDDEDAKPK